MRSYEIVLDPEEKQSFLNDNWAGPEKTYPTVKCLQCEIEFATFNFKATLQENGGKAIRCAAWPECDGTIIDWVPSLPLQSLTPEINENH